MSVAILGEHIHRTWIAGSHYSSPILGTCQIRRYNLGPCVIFQHCAVSKNTVLKPIRLSLECGLFTFDFIIIEAAIAILTLKTKTRLFFVSFTPGGDSVYPNL